MRILLDSRKDTTWGSIHDGSYQSNTKMASAIALFVIAVLLISLYICSKCFFRCPDRGMPLRINAYLQSFSITHSPLDPKVLPLFVYSARTRESPLEDCSICLAAFEAGDEGRVLPRCGHVFHVDCIDKWFKARSMCPLCRSSVLPIDPVVPVIPPIVNTQAGSSSSSTEACERKSLELAGITVEIPNETEATRPDPVNA